MKFRKRPVEIEAEQHTKHGMPAKGVCLSTSCMYNCCEKPHVHTIHDNQIVILEYGDWIIPERDGEHYYPVKPDIFEMTYDKVCEFDMLTIELKEEYAEEVFEILCGIPFEPASMTDSEPPTTRHRGVEDILTQLQRFVLDDEMEE